MKLAILGGGAWGTALAIAMSARHEIRLWLRDAAQAGAMASMRRNERYLPEVGLPSAVGIHTGLQPALASADVALVATPTSALRSMLVHLRGISPALPVVWACKGFERATACLPHQIVAQELPGQTRVAVLSGPSFALEVARGQPTALTLASRDQEFARSTARALHQPTLRVYYADDVVGVEIGGAVKNVLAIATGICDGLGLGLNARAALITRGLAELTRLGKRMGGRPETFMGLTGAGDLILTCTGELSRNRKLGLQLAGGKSLQEALGELGHVAEGFESAREVLARARKMNIEMPITAAVCAVLFDGLKPQAAAEALLSRDPTVER
jgi:glycerol-3-phosphate dehydrogenase (NAD(P)+)